MLILTYPARELEMADLPAGSEEMMMPIKLSCPGTDILDSYVQMWPRSTVVDSSCLTPANLTSVLSEEFLLLDLGKSPYSTEKSTHHWNDALPEKVQP